MNAMDSKGSADASEPLAPAGSGASAARTNSGVFAVSAGGGTYQKACLAAPPDAVAIVGPTASGKSALAIALARAIGGEIVSCDSQYVYRRLDVGTAKPTAEELRSVPHHLVDVCEPTQQLSAGDYVGLADAAIDDIRRRGKRVVIVGGTGLWLRSLLFGMIDVPEASPRLRERLQLDMERLGRAAMFHRLETIDPDAAARIDKNNGVRILRALELFELTGTRPSELWARHAFKKPRYKARVFALNPPRDVLYKRINQRTEAMFKGGLLEEAKALEADGLSQAAAVTRAIGYSQAMAVVRGEMSVERAIEETAKLSRHYAKRQWTWFRAEKSVEWLEAWDGEGALREVLERLEPPPSQGR